MKVSKIFNVVTTVFLTLTVSVSSSASDLVKVEPVSKVEFSHQVQLDIAHSVKTMQFSLAPAKNTATTILVSQTQKLNKDKRLVVAKVGLIAE